VEVHKNSKCERSEAPASLDLVFSGDREVRKVCFTFNIMIVVFEKFKLISSAKMIPLVHPKLLEFRLWLLAPPNIIIFICATILLSSVCKYVGNEEMH